MNIKTKIVALGRILLRAITRDYELWRIYSIATEQCSPRKEHFDIRPIEDLSILSDVPPEEELGRANMQRPGAIGFGAWSGSELKGVCWFWPGPLLVTRNLGEQACDCAELVDISVARSARGNGIATVLIRHGGHQLYCAGYKRLYAQIWPTNTASMRAFEKAGWEQIAWFLQFRFRFCSKKITLRYRSRNSGRTRADALGNWRILRPGYKTK